MGSIDDVIEPKTLTKAIEIVLKRKYKTNPRDTQTTAKHYSELLLNYFGFEEMILDFPLNQKVRDVFYMFEDSGILSTLKEVDNDAFTKMDKCGKPIFKEWRSDYWLLKRSNVTDIIKEEKQSIKEAAKTKDDPDYMTEKYNALYEKAFNDYATTPG